MRAINVAKLVDCAMSALDKEGINKVALVAFKRLILGMISGRVSDLRKEMIWYIEIKIFTN